MGEKNNTDKNEKIVEMTEEDVITATTEKKEKLSDQVSQKESEDNINEQKAEINVETLQQLLKKEVERSKENHDRALRIQAEMENLRKRTTRDIENAHKFALEKFVNELLPILDSMTLGIDAAESVKSVNELCKGMELTLKMFNSTLEKFGVQTIEAKGEKFNPEQHEAISMQETKENESGTIIDVMQKGYQLNGRLVRPAMVIVEK